MFLLVLVCPVSTVGLSNISQRTFLCPLWVRKLGPLMGECVTRHTAHVLVVPPMCVIYGPHCSCILRVRVLQSEDCVWPSLYFLFF